MSKKDSQQNPKKMIFHGGAEKDYFIENLALLISSGMSMLSAIEAISYEIKSKRLKKIIEGLKDDIGAGFSFSKAIERAGLFPEHIISLVRIGEKSGRLSENLKIISTSQKKDRSFRSKIYSAMMYPVLVLVLIFVIGTGIAWFILPRLAQTFSQLNLSLPLLTRMLIGVGNFFSSYGIIAVPSFLAIFFALIYFLFFFPKTRFLGQDILFSLPIIKSMIQEIELSRAGFILGTLFQAGLPVIDAINSLADISSVPAYKTFYLYLKDSVSEGKSFQKSFTAYPKIKKLIPVPVQQLIFAGEQSGKLASVLVKIGETYEEKSDLTTKNLVVILEPILLVIIWVGVLLVAVAVILPIYSLISGLKTQ